MTDKKDILQWKISNHDSVQTTIVAYMTDSEVKNSAQSVPEGGPVNPGTFAIVTLPTEQPQAQMLALRSDNGFPVCYLGTPVEMDQEDEDYDDTQGGRQATPGVITKGAWQRSSAVFTLLKKALADPFSYTSKRLDTTLSGLILNRNRNEAVADILHNLSIRGLLPEVLLNDFHLTNVEAFSNTAPLMLNYLDKPWAYFDLKQAQTFYIYAVGNFSATDTLPAPNVLAQLTITPPTSGVPDFNRPDGGFTFSFQDSNDESQHAALSWQEGKLIFPGGDIINLQPAFIKRELI